MPKCCVFEDCDSNSERHPNVEFAPFVKPSQDLPRAQLWVKRVARLDFETETISKNTYVCQRHFPPGSQLQYWNNKELTPFPKGQALTHYLRYERRESRDDSREEESLNIDREKAKEDYRNVKAKSVKIKRVPVLCGVPIPVNFKESDINTSVALDKDSEQISLPGNFIFFLGLNS